MVLHGDKDTTVVIIPREMYIEKLKTMIEDGIDKENTWQQQTVQWWTLNPSKISSTKIYQKKSTKNSSTTGLYTHIRLVLNQSTRPYTPAKTHIKFVPDYNREP